MPSFPLRVLVTPNETLPGRLNWSLVVMDSCKRGEEFKVLRGQDGRIACQTDRQLAKYKYTSGDVLIPVGMIDNRHYSILRAVALSAGIEHKIGWTTLDWVNDILQALLHRRHLK